MRLSPATRLGPYEIVSSIGAVAGNWLHQSQSRSTFGIALRRNSAFGRVHAYLNVVPLRLLSINPHVMKNAAWLLIGD